MALYIHPEYYEIAFGFVKPKKQVDLIERYIARYSKREVKTLLDLGCGPSLQLREFAKRGYSCSGLDKSPQMLSYLKGKAEEGGINIELIQGDFINFKLKSKVDLAMIMMGTIGMMRSNDDFLEHLDSVAGVLKKGGLYMIEDFMLDWKGDLFGPASWTMKRGGIKVRTTFDVQLIDGLEQIIKVSIVLDVIDNGIIRTVKDIRRVKLIFPQELVELVKLNGKFEFLGWFERNSIRKLKKPSLDNVILLRRK